MKKILKIYGFLILFVMGLYCRGEWYEDKQIISISIPKCGTHLLLKCIQLLTGRDFINWTPAISEATNENFQLINFYKVSMNALQALTNLDNSLFLKTHLFYSEEYAAYLSNEKFIKFFIYRDPRDMAVSFAFFMPKLKDEWPLAQSMSFDDLLLDIITEGKVFYNFHPPVIGGVAELYNAYLPWLKIPNILIMRFEDLVGPLGEGSERAQFNTIKKIAKHLGQHLSNKKIRDIAKEVFGNSYSFREGKIGSWKKYFKPEHIKAFKEVAGQTLIEWGYEKDLNW